MNDIYLNWGTDLSFGPTGDLAIATGSTATTQKVCRRLLTNSGDYIWHSDYGASLANFVGSPVDSARIEGVIRSQLLLEPAVSASPAPTISVNLTDPANGVVAARITYTDTSSPGPIVFDVATGTGVS
jgi:hypothetical protein